MAGKVLAVAKREEIERLKGLGLTDRAIARVLGCSRTIKLLTCARPALPATPLS